MKESQGGSGWFAYVIACGLGLAFSATLLVLAWQNALNNERRQFSFEAASLADKVSRSVNASDDVANNIAVLFAAVTDLSEPAFGTFVRSALERYRFIVAASYHPLVKGGHEPAPARGAAGRPLPGHFPLLHEVARPGAMKLGKGYDLAANPLFFDSLRMALDTGVAVPTPDLFPHDEACCYLLLKAVYPNDSGSGSSDGKGFGTPQGMVAVMVSPGALLGASAESGNLSIKLYTESEGISGRQLLYRRTPTLSGPDAAHGWIIANLDETSAIQFPHYSVKLDVSKPVYWGDIEHGLLYTALLLGFGVTLLLVALARAKELQARELRERNAVIERQVQEQTKELALARDQALEASRVKSDFLASMSHEIRTPLNAIIGMAELLSETRLSQEQLRYVNVFRRAGEALLSLVNDILDLSKIEAGQLVLENIDFDLTELMEEAVEIYALKTDEKGIELVCQIEPDVPNNLQGDPTRLRQIVLNLIGNAIKFTEGGEIALRVRRDPDGTEPGDLLFAVADTGIGIPADKLEAIFGSFSQVDSSTTRKYGGTGLGLTISRKLVEMMGGRIQVESEEGKGSVFSFSVHFGIGRHREGRASPSAIDLHGLRVLVIDDNSTNRLILNQILSSRGAVVTEAGDGPAALKEIEAARSEDREYRLILLDCRMPKMDGFEVAEAIKRRGGDIKTVMMLTSASLGSYLTKARDMGFGAYLVKPVKRAELLKALGEALSRRPEATERKVAEAVDPDETTMRRILLVEDTADNRLLIKAYLKKQPFEVDEAENGEVAVEKFKAGHYDLVLMDVQMPVMDGYTATKLMREWEKELNKQPVPIIALTAHAIREDMDKSLAAGCTAHLTKPIKKATLLQSLGEYLS